MGVRLEVKKLTGEKERGFGVVASIIEREREGGMEGTEGGREKYF